MQSSKKKLLKIIGLILLIIVVGAGWWAADFFLIPKAQQKLRAEAGARLAWPTDCCDAYATMQKFATTAPLPGKLPPPH